MTKLPQVLGTSLCMAQYPHPHDKHLWVVLHKWNRNEYAVHLYNSQDGGYHDGSYFAALHGAHIEYTDRVAKAYNRYLNALVS